VPISGGVAVPLPWGGSWAPTLSYILLWDIIGLPSNRMWPELRLIVKLRIEARPWIDAGPHIQAGGLIHEFVLIQAGPSLVLSLICLSADKQTRLSTRLGPASNHKSSAVAEMDDHLATIDMGRKVGGGLLWLCPFP